MTKEPRHIYEVEIAAPPEKVWDALNDPRQEFNAGWTLEYDRTGPGALHQFRDAEGRTMIEGEVLDYEPPHRLVTTSRQLWSDEVTAEKPSRVSYEIERTGNGSRLTLIHDGFESKDSPTYRAVEHGWPPILEALKALVEERPDALAAALDKQA